MDNVLQTAAPAALPPAFDPVETVTRLLTEHSHHDPEGWKAYMDPNHARVDPTAVPPRFFVNRALRTVLGELDIAKVVTPESDGKPISTMDDRFCIIDRCSDSDWEKMIRERIVPCMIKYNLPLKSE